MATINVYRITEDRFAVVVGDLRDGAPCIGFQIKPESTPEKQ